MSLDDNICQTCATAEQSAFTEASSAAGAGTEAIPSNTIPFDHPADNDESPFGHVAEGQLEQHVEVGEEHGAGYTYDYPSQGLQPKGSLLCGLYALANMIKETGVADTTLSFPLDHRKLCAAFLLDIFEGGGLEKTLDYGVSLTNAQVEAAEELKGMGQEKSRIVQPRIGKSFLTYGDLRLINGENRFNDSIMQTILDLLRLELAKRNINDVLILCTFFSPMELFQNQLTRGGSRKSPYPQSG